MKGDGIREGIELLDNVLDGADRIVDALEDLVSGTLGYDFRYEPVAGAITIAQPDKQMLGVVAQDTMLGTFSYHGVTRSVVACKDFTTPSTVVMDFASVKNQIISKMTK